MSDYYIWVGHVRRMAPPTTASRFYRKGEQVKLEYIKELRSKLGAATPVREDTKGDYCCFVGSEVSAKIVVGQAWDVYRKYHANVESVDGSPIIVTLGIGIHPRYWRAQNAGILYPSEVLK